MWRLFFLWSRNLDHIYFLLQYVAIVCQSIHFLFYFITYIQDMYTCVKNYLIFLLLFPQILYYFSICTIFYIYFTIASRENNYSLCRYGLIDILYKSYLRNYKKLLFMQITKSWLELFKQSYFFLNLIVTSFFDNRIYPI